MFPFNNFFPPEVVAFVSDRKVDFSLNGKNPVLTTVQQEYLRMNFGARQIDLAKVSTVVQVHGNRILVGEGELRQGVEEADGLITNLKNLPIAVRTADCLPIFLYAPKEKCIGLIHAGWRGTQKAIVQEAIRGMVREYGVNPIDIKAALGPGIRSCCYEVDEEMKNYFPKEISSRSESCYLDLPLVNIRQLREMGVEEKNIFDCGICTCCDINYFSYRREGDAAGRMISLMMIKN